MSKRKTKVYKTSIAKRLGAPTITMAPSTTGLKLDLACGQRPREGFEGVDIVACPGVKHVVDLQKYPWPFEDNSVDEVVCSHYAEHIPMTVDVTDLLLQFVLRPEMSTDRRNEFLDEIKQRQSQDPLFRFFDEMWRIMKPDAFAEIIVPSGRSDRGFQDPTHRRFFVEATFLYMNAEWRKLNLLDHYNVKCNFGVAINHTVDSVINTMHPEAQTRHIRNYWNSTVDLVAKLKAIK